jgi:oligopeptide transport system ATP-binding protein
MMTAPLLQARNVKMHFPVRKGFFLREVGRVKAVDGVDLDVHPGETIGLVGESGCGKSTLGRTLIRLYEPTDGTIRFQGEDFLALTGETLRAARKDIQMVFQDPFASLDPRMTIAQILAEPYKVHDLCPPKERKDKAAELLETVGLKAAYLNRYPHEFSGGQRQRISIARSLALRPKLIIADEPVSALDVSIQAQILNLLKDLQEQFQLTYVFISHDLSVVDHFCDRIAVMYLGRIIEMAPRDELFEDPKHPYTKALIQAIPRVGRGKKKMQQALKGEVPSPLNPPTGCHFHPRCPEFFDGCDKGYPELKVIGEAHRVACKLYDEGAGAKAPPAGEAADESVEAPEAKQAEA